MDIDISNLDPAAVLAALYNASKPQGVGLLHFNPAPMTVDEARELLKVGKVTIDPAKFSPRLYDRNNGDGAAGRALAPLLAAVRA